ncbi:MAG: YbfB/YjiJ family MFS transporter [Caldimonas sp.]
MSGARAPLPALAVAAALALGSAVSLGLARFSYGLLLPLMRSDLGWSYFTAGAMNTVNAAGYLAGALGAPVCLRRFGARPLLIASTAATALALAAHGVVSNDVPLYALRLFTGVGSAFSLVAGAVMAAQLGGVPGGPQVGASAGTARGDVPAGLVVGLYYGGTGVGIVASAGLVPLLGGGAGAHAWQPAWIGLGATALLATLVLAWATRGRGDGTSGGAARADARDRFEWQAFAPGLVAYLLFGLGYIGYMTFVVTLLREQHMTSALITAFFAMLGLAVIASSWIWAGMLQRFRGGESLSLLNGLLAVATALPVISARPLAVFASGLLFGAVFLSIVSSTTSLVRHNLAATLWPAGIAAFTVVFAAGQIVGPALAGLIADRFGGLRAGLGCSAAVLALAALCAWRQKPLRAA